MIISPLISNNVLYINLHAEQAFFGTFHADVLNVSKNIITGIYDQELNLSILEKVLNYVKRNKKHFNILVLDFERLITAQKNLDGKLIEIKNEIKYTILKNINITILDKLNLNDCFDRFGNKSNDDFQHDHFVLNDDSSHKLSDIVSAKKVFDQEFEKMLVKITRPNTSKKIHHSSPVYLSNFIDIKELIVKNKALFYYSCYWLAIEMTKKTTRTWLIEKGARKTLLCQNLNSSFIASVLSSYLLLDVITLDHIGPINKVYNEIDKKIRDGEEYIVVSDVVCMGTEVRIAKNIIEFSGGKYIGNVSIVRIMTMEYEDKYNDTESVYDISKDKNPIGFKITTALN
jgi:hypothetical protein